MRYLALLVAILIVACAPPDLDFQVAPNAPAIVLDTALALADEACNVTDGERCPTFTRGPATSTLCMMRANEGVLGSTWKQMDGTLWIGLAVGLVDYPDQLRRVLRHELGHAMGCWRHTDGALAEYDDPEVNTYTAEDIACILDG